MKNKFYERRKMQAKLTHKNRTGILYENGVIVRHVYDPQTPQLHTWWDDTGFILNDYRVGVAWRHPRLDYQEQVRDLVSEEITRRGADYDFSGMFNNDEPNYVPVGKSRKKIVSYTVKPFGDDAAYQTYRSLQEQLENEMLLDSNICIAPSMTVEWTGSSRFVSICCPMEVRGVDDLVVLAALVKRILKGETTLSAEFPSYAYCAADWKHDFDVAAPQPVHTHGVAF